MNAQLDDFLRWQKALAMTETNDNPHLWGDQGLAVGRWQMHPVFVDRWWPDAFNTSDTTSWDDLFEICLKNFFDMNAPAAPEATTLAMWFHLHGGPGAGWDQQYADRFNKFYAQVN